MNNACPPVFFFCMLMSISDSLHGRFDTLASLARRDREVKCGSENIGEISVSSRPTISPEMPRSSKRTGSRSCFLSFSVCSLGCHYLVTCFLCFPPSRSSPFYLYTGLCKHGCMLVYRSSGHITIALALPVQTPPSTSTWFPSPQLAVPFSPIRSTFVSVSLTSVFLLCSSFRLCAAK